MNRKSTTIPPKPSLKHSSKPSSQRGGLKYPLLFGFLLGSLGVWLLYENQWLFQQLGSWRGNDKQSSRAPTEAQPKPEYFFYSHLPEQEVVVLEEEIADTPKVDTSKTVAEEKLASTIIAAPTPATAATKSAAKTAPVSTSVIQYVLQAGSFRSPKEADKLRAKLSLAGFQVRIQTVQIDGAITWHRVRTGPYNSKSTLQQARQELRQQGIKPLALRLKQQRQP